MDKSEYEALKTRVFANLRSREYRPIVGWPLQHCCELDEIAPGFLRAMTLAGPKQRHATWAAFAQSCLLDQPARFLELATGELVADEQSHAMLLAEVARLLPLMSAKEIVEAAFRHEPHGFGAFGGALAKLEPEPLSREQYLALYGLFTSRDLESRRRRKTIEQLPQLNSTRLQIALLVDPALVTPTAVVRLGTVGAATDFQRGVEVIRRCCSHATDEALRASLEAPGWRSVSAFVRSWLSRADRVGVPEAPVIDDPEVEIVSPETAARIGAEFGNCLRTKAIRLASGCWAAYVWHPERLIVTATKLVDGSWMLTGVHRPRNGPTTRQDLLKVAEKFQPWLRCTIPAEPPPGFEASRFAFGGDLLEDWEIDGLDG